MRDPWAYRDPVSSAQQGRLTHRGNSDVGMSIKIFRVHRS